MDVECLKRGQPNLITKKLLRDGKLYREGKSDICSAKLPMLIQNVNGQDITCTPDDPVACPYFEALEKRRAQGV